MKVSTCGSCAARVIWAITAKGETMPVDADPVDDGDRWLVKAKTGSTPIVVKAAEETTHGALYKSHFATCPNAERHRRSA